MKKFILILLAYLTFSSNTWAEIYHGIDIDVVYESSDWNNKEDIKKLIDDYTLLLQYQVEFNNCSGSLPDVFSCYDNIAKKIITHLYISPKINLNQYNQLKEVLSEAYGLKNCRNKYAWPSGNICEIDTDLDLAKALKVYIQSLIDSSKEKMFLYSSILEKYN